MKSLKEFLFQNVWEIVGDLFKNITGGKLVRFYDPATAWCTSKLSPAYLIYGFDDIGASGYEFSRKNEETSTLNHSL